MRKITVLVIAMLVFCLSVTVSAENGVKVEVIKVDGVSVVVLTPEDTMLRARSIAMNAQASGPEKEAFELPRFLTVIGESAFEGIAAKKVEVTENVTAIEARAFADCKSLREIIIPATVVKIDDHAFDGCENVTVYGMKGTEAERIVRAVNAADPNAGFVFVDVSAEAETPGVPSVQEGPPAVLPFVPAE